MRDGVVRKYSVNSVRHRTKMKGYKNGENEYSARLFLLWRRVSRRSNSYLSERGPFPRFLLTHSKFCIMKATKIISECELFRLFSLCGEAFSSDEISTRLETAIEHFVERISRLLRKRPVIDQLRLLAHFVRLSGTYEVSIRRRAESKRDISKRSSHT